MMHPVGETTGAGALRPVRAADGLVVTIRPFDGRLRRAQADGIATLAAAHGSGTLQLTPRGELSVLGVRDDTYPALIEGLRGMALLDTEAEAEQRRNLLVTPFWQTGGETAELAPAFSGALAAAGAPDLPEGFTFALDTARDLVLQGAAADIRLERDAAGGLILVADGADKGKLVTTETAAQEALALAGWFLDARQQESRMAALLKAGAGLPADHFVPRQTQSYRPAPGYTPLGSLIGIPQGRLSVETLAGLAKQGGLRLTPWHMLLVEGTREFPGLKDIITDPQDPRLALP